MENLLEEIQQLLHQFEDVFCEKHERGRTMKIEPVDIKVDKEREKPPMYQAMISSCTLEKRE